MAPDVLIVGSGPAGMSTALHLARSDPGWARRILVLEKGVHPREKVCGGAITQAGLEALSRLGLPFEPASVPIRELSLAYGGQAFAFRGDPVLRIVHRGELDHWLVRVAAERGIEVRQATRVVAVRPGPREVEVETDRGTFRSPVLVAADGARSTVRRSLGWADLEPASRLLEVLMPEPEGEPGPDFAAGRAGFDFGPAASGVQGYYWDFPSLVRGRPVMNRGLFDSRVCPRRPGVSLKQQLGHALARRGHGLEGHALAGHPIRRFDRRASFARHRILLAGDAAGADPLLGEGISFALGYGEVAAAAIADAFARRDFRFSGYRASILAHPLLRRLPALARMAKVAYFARYPSWLVAALWKALPALLPGARAAGPYQE